VAVRVLVVMIGPVRSRVFVDALEIAGRRVRHSGQASDRPLEAVPALGEATDVVNWPELRIRAEAA
jgi:hypothetical protein